MWCAGVQIRVRSQNSLDKPQNGKEMIVSKWERNGRLIIFNPPVGVVIESER